MSTQPEALRLADALDDDEWTTVEQMHNAAAELRRLHEANQAMLEALKRIAKIELQMNGGDWDEITEAQAIAEAAIAKGEQS